MDNNFNQISGFGTQLDKYMMPVNSPITQQSALPGILFDMQNEINGRFARLSLVNIKNFIAQSGTSGVGFGLPNNGSAVITTSSAFNPPHQSDPMFDQMFIAIYQGTAPSGTGQIYPSYGASVDPTKYLVRSWHDFGAYNSGNTSNVATTLVNLTGGSQDLYFASVSKYIQYNSGIST